MTRLSWWTALILPGWRIDVFSRWPSDRWSMVEIWFHRVKKQRRGFFSFVGSWSGGSDLIGGPSASINLNRYNGSDQQWWSTHLNDFYTTCVDLDRVDPVFTESTPCFHREDHPTHETLPRRLQNLNWWDFSPTPKNFWRFTSI